MNIKSAIAEIREMLRDIRRDHMLSGCVNDVKTIVTAYNAKRQALRMAVSALEEKAADSNSVDKLHRAVDLLREHCKAGHYCCAKCTFYSEVKETCTLVKPPHTWTHGRRGNQ